MWMLLALLRVSLSLLLWVKPCDICGDLGFEEKIVTCFECQKTREHVYCMRVLLFIVPEIWLCEACRSGRGKEALKSVEQELHFETSTSNDNNGEAMEVSLEARKELKLSSRNDLRSRPGSSQMYATVTKSQRTCRFKTTPRKFSWPRKYRMVNSNPGVRGAAYCRPLGQGSVENHTVTRGQVSQTSKELEDVRSQSFNVEEKNLQILAIYEPYNSFSSTSFATWSGSIKICNLESCSELFDGFQAYSANTVRRKALEFSKQMPGVLLCSLLPRASIWLEVFQNDPPNIDDIALIFWPGNFERSKEQYVKLLGRIEMQDGVLKSRINGVELLIFSSKSFHANSSGFKLGSFLWGLYSSVKSNDPISQTQGKSPNVGTNIKRSGSEVKIEPFYDPDVPPGFTRPTAADATAGG